MLILRDLLERYQQIGSETLSDIISDYYLYDEKEYVEQIKLFTHLSPEEEQGIEQLARTLISVAQESKQIPLINQVLSEYQLNQKEGIQLLALAEGLLRIKSPDTAYRFIQDKIVSGDWEAHKHKSDHSSVNLATEGLTLLKQWLSKATSDATSDKTPFGYWLNAGKNLLAQEALKLLINKLASIFIKGSTIESALSKATDHTQHCCSFDMLGEAALTEDDAERYLKNYMTAIDAVAEHQTKNTGQVKKSASDKKTDSAKKHRSKPRHSLSIKLSALTPRFTFRHQYPELERTFLLRIEALVRNAHQQNVAITLDAEEADQLELTLKVFQHLFLLPGLKGWGQLGIAVQAYGFRTVPTILYLSQLAKEHQTRIPIRLVKGAYWDTEIHKAQEMGLSGYPVFTQKSATDLNYQACCQILLKLQMEGWLQPQFATHNAVTIATVISLAEDLDPERQHLFPIEFQRLHGMGETIYSALSGYRQTHQDYYCRSYCPVGPYQELLPYLIRRILENGANQSFLNHLSQGTVSPPKKASEAKRSATEVAADIKTDAESESAVSDETQDTMPEPPTDDHELEKIEADALAKLPIHGLIQYDRFRPDFPLPQDIYLPWLKGSLGLNVNHPLHLKTLLEETQDFSEQLYQVEPALPENIHHQINSETLYSPNDQEFRLGLCHTLNQLDQQHLKVALKESYQWSSVSPEQRIAVIEQFALILEHHKYELIALCINEAGKTWQDAIGEIREAIDFCHYYAQSYKGLAQPITLPNAANESNKLIYRPKGTFLCISPWNFPIAILTGQVVAALVTGNRVLIKPAPQTQICGRRIYDFLIASGIPKDSLYFLPATNQLSQQLVGNPQIDGIAFTGSLATAQVIQQELLNQRSYAIPLISETSGLNCMITDDSILTEQMVKDVVSSAFGSAGQRCSALRVLFIHESIYQETIDAIIGVMKRLKVDHPRQFDSDLGPIIDEAALERLQSYIQTLQEDKKLLYQIQLPEMDGHYFAPALVKLHGIKELTKEHFGPILHVIKYKSNDINQLIQDIEDTDYALTLGIHSRDKHWIDFLCTNLSMGNIYINRHITGAQVAAQPFGGHKKSGSGFKAGGPNYLLQFVNEQCISENIAAIGGNVNLINLPTKR
ncbi:proline dehydrogenase family protein [Litoribrevibacter euphylliae]|uniref:Bifunctional protein PutA n=1 Tax=Litoribrevibacter euphylliae TaxID=1834034 RepID=A0ABV7H829_9GAMM